MKFIIYKVENGFLLNIYYSKEKAKSYIYSEKERMTMLAMIDKICGEEPENSTGMEKSYSLNKEKDFNKNKKN